MLAQYCIMMPDLLSIQDFEKYLRKRKRLISTSTHGFGRGQHDLILQIMIVGMSENKSESMQ
jgi:hypothetical protein